MLGAIDRRRAIMALSDEKSAPEEPGREVAI
jgi:hypothetical protein